MAVVRVVGAFIAWLPARLSLFSAQVVDRYPESSGRLSAQAVHVQWLVQDALRNTAGRINLLSLRIGGLAFVG